MNNALVLDPDVVAGCIASPQRHHTDIVALLDLCASERAALLGTTRWMAYLGELMVSVRLAFAQKDLRFTRRLITDRLPVHTLFFLERLQEETTVRKADLRAADVAGHDALSAGQMALARQEDALYVSRDPVPEGVRACTPERLAAILQESG